MPTRAYVLNSFRSKGMAAAATDCTTKADERIRQTHLQTFSTTSSLWRRNRTFDPSTWNVSVDVSVRALHMKLEASNP